MVGGHKQAQTLPGSTPAPEPQGLTEVLLAVRPTSSQSSSLILVLSLDTCYCLRVALAPLPSLVSFLGCFRLCGVFLKDQPSGVRGRELARGLGRQGYWPQGPQP